MLKHNTHTLLVFCQVWLSSNTLIEPSSSYDSLPPISPWPSLCWWEMTWGRFHKSQRTSCWIGTVCVHVVHVLVSSIAHVYNCWIGTVCVHVVHVLVSSIAHVYNFWCLCVITTCASTWTQGHISIAYPLQSMCCTALYLTSLLTFTV